MSSVTNIDPGYLHAPHTKIVFTDVIVVYDPMTFTPKTKEFEVQEMSIHGYNILFQELYYFADWVEHERFRDGLTYYD
jgi:hypothetical protein